MSINSLMIVGALYYCRNYLLTALKLYLSHQYSDKRYLHYLQIRQALFAS